MSFINDACYFRVKPFTNDHPGVVGTYSNYLSCFLQNLTCLYWNNDILSFTMFAHLEVNQIVYPPLGDISGFRCKKLDV